MLTVSVRKKSGTNYSAVGMNPRTLCIAPNYLRQVHWLPVQDLEPVSPKGTTSMPLRDSGHTRYVAKGG